MASTKTLLEVQYHDDDDTGMYELGEIDFGIHGVLDQYLMRYGKKGRDDIIDTLKHLAHQVDEKWQGLGSPATPE